MNRKIFLTLVGTCLACFVAVLYMIFIYVPTEATMGVVQRIFYFHVPLAWVSFLAFLILFVASILYLWKRDTKWDILAYISAEIGVLFTTLFVVTGSIWARPIWGVWWTWDPRLTSALVLWLIYVVYLLVRSFTADDARGTRFAAVVGIIGFVDVPIVALSITLWRTQHPSPVIFEGGLEPKMIATLVLSLVTFTLLYFVLQMLRTSIKHYEIEIDSLKNIITRGWK